MAHHEEENQTTVTVEQLKSTKNGKKIPLAKLQQLKSSVPKQLQSVIKGKYDVIQWYTCLCPNIFLSVLQASITKTKRIKFISETDANLFFVLLSVK